MYLDPKNWELPVTLLLTLLVGWYDFFQRKEAILRAYPIIGHLRFILLGISPEIHQYFTESNTAGLPFSKNMIKLIKTRADGKEEYHPFGSEKDFYAEGLEGYLMQCFLLKSYQLLQRLKLAQRYVKNHIMLHCAKYICDELGSL